MPAVMDAGIRVDLKAGSFIKVERALEAVVAVGF